MPLQRFARHLTSSGILLAVSGTGDLADYRCTSRGKTPSSNEQTGKANERADPPDERPLHLRSQSSSPADTAAQSRCGRGAGNTEGEQRFCLARNLLHPGAGNGAPSLPSRPADRIQPFRTLCKPPAPDPGPALIQEWFQGAFPTLAATISRPGTPPAEKPAPGIPWRRIRLRGDPNYLLIRAFLTHSVHHATLLQCSNPCGIEH